MLFKKFYKLFYYFFQYYLSTNVLFNIYLIFTRDPNLIDELSYGYSGLYSSLVFMQELAHAGKIAQGLFIARKKE